MIHDSWFMIRNSKIIQSRLPNPHHFRIARQLFYFCKIIILLRIVRTRPVRDFISNGVNADCRIHTLFIMMRQLHRFF